MPLFPSISSLKSADRFLQRLADLNLELPFDETLDPHGSLAQPIPSQAGPIGNRWCILPMEGWDGTIDGRPTDRTRRRWENFGRSGAKLIFGGEAVAVRHDGRANPNQLLITPQTLGDLADLRERLVQVHQQEFSRTDDLLVGLQLTHSGRFARPNEKRRPEPRVLYRHPLLDSRVGVIDDGPIFSDDDLMRLRNDFIAAGRLARQAGFAFVDVKHCHGYLGHEFLSAYDRPGRYGGAFENRTRFLREIVEGLRVQAPGLHVAVRASIFDFSPFQPGADRVGVPSHEAANGPYRPAFGGDGTGGGLQLDEAAQLCDLFADLEIQLVCTTAGSPYYNPHLQRPAAFPPSDGYLPPEDPLVGVVRQIAATAELKRRRPDRIVIGSAYSYLQDWLPNVAQAVVSRGWADLVGLGRMVLSYPTLPADQLAGRPLQRKLVCRTFSDCTTAPRNGIVSGCYPLDPYYKQSPEYAELQRVKPPAG